MGLWGLLLAILGLAVLASAFFNIGLFVILLIIWFFLAILSIRIVFEFQRGVLFTFGKYSGMRNPGFNVIIPLVQSLRIVDLRINVSDVPEQTPITKDNVSLTVDAVIYFRIRKNEAQNSIIKVEDYSYAINQLAQTTMRNIIGEMMLDEVLSNRDEASKKIQYIVDKASDPWGIKVEAVELKHVELPESMKTIMAKAAEAERIKRAAIIKASGEAMAAEVVSKAAEIISSVEGGLNLRTLQELDNIASDTSNEVMFFVPLDTIRPIEGYAKHKKPKQVEKK
ncbi:MAG: slipin family protein [Candidatus Diapherotrites archaeon]|nr:slipin family protein [Candidatus Diapherotrites archaeon]